MPGTIPGTFPFARTQFIIMPESNLALASSTIKDNLNQVLNKNEFHILGEDGDRPGWRTDNQLKEIGTALLKNVLECGSLRFHSSFFTRPAGKNLEKYFQQYKNNINLTAAFYESAMNDQNSKARSKILDLAVHQLREEIVRQFCDWKEEIIYDVRGNAKKFYSGKYGQKPDDLCMCFVGGILMVKKWQNTVRMAIRDAKDSKDELLNPVNSFMQKAY